MQFSIIIPVLNEETVLESTLQHVQQCASGYNHELIIVDGGSHDRTVGIAQRYGRVIHSVRGRARQMNTGAASASGTILLFLHADTKLPDGAFTSILQALTIQQTVGGAFRLSFDSSHWLYHYVALGTNIRSRLFRVFTGDQAYFIRTSSFQAIGGYPDQPLMEDVEIIARLRRVGRVVLLPLAVTTSARRHEHIGLLRSVFFMWYLRMLYHFGTSPARLQRMYSDIR